MSQQHADSITNDRRALYASHPRRWDVPVLIFVSTVLLITGLMLPTLKLTKIIFFVDTYSIWQSVLELWWAKHFVLAAVIFFFSIIFPFGKLLMLAAVWAVPMNPAGRHRALHWLGVLGKWSMLDVFVVATIIVLVKAQDVADAEAQIGIYFFAAAIALSMIATTFVQRLARNVR